MKKAEILLEYQPYIDEAPTSNKQLYSSACSSDQVTINHWASTWLTQMRQNKEHFGSFRAHSVGQLFGQHQYLPCIIAGSGPSLANSIEGLKNRGRIPLVSCLHNFHFMEDNGVQVDYYVSLDAGPVTIEEISEGGNKKHDEYWELTKDRTLIAFIGTYPELLRKWQGRIFFFNAPVPDEKHMEKVDEIEVFRSFVSSGGNVLGSCLYISKTIFGCNPIAFTGADLSFGYNHKFHSWDSKYDATMGKTVRMTDCYGIPVKSWPSYQNFKYFFDFVCQTVPGIYYNCSEGGTLGAYPGGNIRAIKQCTLADFLNMYHMNEPIRESMENPTTDQKRVLF